MKNFLKKEVYIPIIHSLFEGKLLGNSVAGLVAGLFFVGLVDGESVGISVGSSMAIKKKTNAQHTNKNLRDEELLRKEVDIPIIHSLFVGKLLGNSVVSTRPVVLHRLPGGSSDISHTVFSIQSIPSETRANTPGK